MVAIIGGGNALGLTNSSASTLGREGLNGNPAVGRTGQQAYVNTATGNLVVQSQDEVVKAAGLDLDIVRTYNSQGLMDDDNGDNWRLSPQKKLAIVNGLFGTTITRTAGDGAQADYGATDLLQTSFKTTEGGGAYDTIVKSGTQWIWTDGSTREVEVYDANGRLQESRDPDGKALKYAYNASGLLTSVTDASGQVTFFDYIGNNLQSIRVTSNSVTQKLVSYAYDASNRLIKVTVDLTPLNTADTKTFVTNYTYEGTSKRISTITQTDGTLVTFTYEQPFLSTTWLVKTVTVTDTVGTRKTTFNYCDGLLGKQCDVVDPLGFTTTYQHDSCGRLTSVLSPDTGKGRMETDYCYDACGNVTGITVDPWGLNRTTCNEFDDRGNVVKTYDAMGNTITRVFDTKNQLVAETRYAAADPDGGGLLGLLFGPSKPMTARYVYDGNNHLRFEITAEGRVTEHRYTGGKRMTTRRYNVGLYNVAGLADTTALTEAQLNTWVAAQSQTNTELTDYAYDFREQLSSMTTWSATTAAGVGTGNASATNYIYDQRGNLLQKIEPRGTSTVDPADYVTTMVYDGLGRLQATTEWVKNGLTRTTSIDYDDLGNKTVSHFANGLDSTSLYSRAGDLISVKNASPAKPDMGTTTNKYDADGRLRMVVDPTGVRQFFYYDAAGRKVASVDGDGSLIEYVYDQSNLLIKTVRYAKLLGTTTLASLVDGAGNPANVSLDALRLSAGGNPTEDQITRNIYNRTGQLVYTVDEAGAVTERVYDGAGRVTDIIEYARTVSIARSTDQLLPLDFCLLLCASDDDRRTRFFYDKDGNLVGKLDPEGYLTEHTYGDSGLRSSTIEYATATPTSNLTSPNLRLTGDLTALRPAPDNETLATPERDNRTYFFYDGNGRQVGVLDGEGYLTETTYDPSGRRMLVIRYDKKLSYAPGATVATLRAAATAGPVNFHASSYVYDGLGRLIRETNFEDTVTVYDYDAAGNLISTIKAYGTTESRNVQARYDALGRLTQELTAEGSAQVAALPLTATPADIEATWNKYSVRHEYDNAGRRIASTDQLGNKTFYYYDNDGRLCFTVNARGEVQEKRYNALGQLTKELSYSNRLGAATVAGLKGGLLSTLGTTQIVPTADTAHDSVATYTYALTGQVATLLTSEGGSVTSVYNAFGEDKSQTTVIDALRSRVTEFDRDKRGLILKTRSDTTGLNFSDSRTYDAFGRVKKITDQRGNTSEIRYDTLGRTVATIDALGSKRVTTYDAFDRVTTQVDALGNTTSYAYNEGTRTMTMTTPEGIAVTTEHNRHGQNIKVTAAGNTTVYGYDLNGRLIKTSDNLGTLEERIYDAAGNQVKQIDGRATTTDLAYDAANRLFTRTVRTSNATLVTTYQYDGQGRVTSVTEPSGRVTATEYDGESRVKNITIDPTGLKLKTSYTYDEEGRTLTVTQGDGSATPRATEYRYDTMGRRTDEIVDPNGLKLTTNYRYDANGNMTRRIDASGQSTWYVYDVDNRQRYSINAQGEVIETFYDAEDRIVGTRAYMKTVVTTNFGDIVTSVPIVTDALDRIERKVYDRDGMNAYSIDGMGTVVERTFDAAGRVTRSRSYANPVVVSAYDTPAQVRTALTNAGNSTTVASVDDRLNWTAYDLRGRVTFTVDGMGGVVQFKYDGNGNVIEKRAYVSPYGTTNPMDEASLSTWAGSHQIADKDQVTRYWYDTVDRQRFLLDAEGFLHESRYDDAGRTRTEVTYQALQSFATGVSLATVEGGIVKTVGKDKTILSHSDLAGRVDERTDGEGFKTKFVYDAVGNRTEVWTQLDKKATPTWAITRAYFDTANRNIGSLTAQGYLTVIDLDALGNAKTSTVYDQTVSPTLDGTRPAPKFGDPGRVTSYTYDKVGRTLTEKNALNIVTRYVYDAHGNRKETYEADGTADVRLTKYVYDAADRMTEFTTAFGTDVATTTKLELDAFGNVHRRREAAGTTVERVFVTDYDSANRVKAETDALLRVTTTVNDAFGNVQERTVAAGTIDAREESFEYDRKNQLTKRKDGLGNETISYTYDAAGNQATSRNANAVRLTSSNDAYYRAYRARLGFKDGSNLGKDFNTLTQVEKDQLNEAMTTHYEYDGNNRLAKVTDPMDAVTLYTYDGAGNRKTMTEAYQSATTAERTTQYDYDQDNRLTKVTDGMGGTTLYEYDVLGMQTKVTDANTAVIKNTYDAIGRLKEVLQFVAGAPGGGIKTTNNYDLRGNMTSSKLAYADGSDARLTRYRYDLRDRQKEITNGEGFSTVITYDLFGNQKTITNGAYLITSTDPDYLYDAKKLQSAPSLKISFDYDAADQMTFMTDGIGDVTKYDHDLAGNRTAVTEAFQSPDGTTPRTTVYDYDGANRLKEVRTPEGGKTRYDYDAAGNKIGEHLLQSGYEALEFATAVWIDRGFEYDANNRLTAEIDPYNIRTEHEYDAIGNVTKHIYAANSGDIRSAKMGYDANNRLHTETDGEGKTTTYDYDKVGNRIKVTDARNKVARYFYDEAARVRKSVDPEQFITEFQYDSAGNRTQDRVYKNRYADPVTNPIPDGLEPMPTASSDDRIVKQDYDKASLLVKLTDADGSVTLTEYDGSGKKTKETAFATAAVPRISSYTYDVAGRLKTFTDVDGTLSEFTYDGANNRLTEKLTNNSDPVATRVRLTKYEYDLNNRRITETFDPTGMALKRTTDYDHLGNVTKTTNGTVEMYGRQSQVVHGELYTYDLNNRTKTHAVGVVAPAGFDGEPISGTGELIGITPILLTTSFTYDDVGNIKTMVNPQGNAKGVTNKDPYTTTYLYDKNNRRTFEIKPETDYYMWDGEKATQGKTHPSVETRYDEVGNIIQTIDANGNKATNYYDGNRRLVAQINAENYYSTYDYDAFGNLKTTIVYDKPLKVGTDWQDPKKRPAVADLPGTPLQTDYEYDKAGRLTLTRLPAITVTTLRDTGTTNPSSIQPAVITRLVEEHRRDVYGNEVETIDRAGNHTLNYYDVKNRKTASIDAMNYMVAWDYDSQDNKLAERVYLTAFTDLQRLALPLGGARPAPPSGSVLTTTNEYDLASRLLKTVSPPTDAFYPDTGVTTAITPTTTYAYDAAGNMLTKTTGAGTAQATTEVYFYDAAFRRIAVIDGNRVVSHFRYDRNGNMVKRERVFGQIPAVINGVTVPFTSTTASDRSVLKEVVDAAIAGSPLVGSQTALSETTSYDYDELDRLVKETDAGDATVGDDRVKTYKYDKSGNRSYVGEGQSGLFERSYATKTQYDALNRVKLTTTPDGSGTAFEYDVAGNRTSVYTGKTFGQAVKWATIKDVKINSDVAVPGSAPKFDITWTMPEEGLRTWIVYDTVPHDQASDYRNATLKTRPAALDGAGSIPAPAAGGTLYFRIVTENRAGNIAWSDQQSVTSPPRLNAVEVEPTSGGKVTIRARFDASVGAPTLAYGSGGSLASNATFTLQPDGSYLATASGIGSEAAFSYQISWKDSAGKTYQTAVSPMASNVQPALTQTSLSRVEVPVNGGVRYRVNGATNTSTALANGFDIVQVQWRPTNSTVGWSYDNATKTPQGANTLLSFSLGKDAPLAANQYDVIISGVRPDGAVVVLDTMQINVGPTALSFNDNIASFDAPSAGSGQLVILGGQALATARRDQGRVLVPVSGTLPLPYQVLYTDPVATSHTVQVASSATTGASVLTVKATLDPGEKSNVGVGGVHVAWKSASSDYRFTNDQVMPLNGAGDYEAPLPSQPAGSYDVKVYYIDKNGREVVVEWQRVSTATATRSFTGKSQSVAGQVAGTFGADGVSLTASQDTYGGGGDLGSLANSQSLNTTLGGVGPGYASGDLAEKGYVLRAKYDALGNKVEETTDDGIYTQYGVDAYGNAVETRAFGVSGGATVAITNAIYDARGRKVKEFKPMATVTGNLQQRPIESFEYDALDNVKSHVEANGHKTDYTYNSYGSKLTETTTDKVGGTAYTITYKYDQFQRETSRRDGRSNESRKAYDLAGNLVRQTDELGHVTRYAYDAFGRVTAKTDPRGTAAQDSYTTRYTYNGHDEVQKVVQAQGWHLANDTSSIYAAEAAQLGLSQATDDATLIDLYTIEYGYDSRGHRNKTTTKYQDLDKTPHTRVEIDRYDGLGRIYEHDLSLDGTAAGSTSVDYDYFGNIISRVDEMDRVKNYTFQRYARVDQDIDEDGNVVQYEYDDFGRVTKEFDPTNTASGKLITRKYDSAGRLLWVDDARTQVHTDYTYDLMGARLTETVKDHGNTVRNITYTHDLKGRLTGWSDSVTGASEQIEYDNNGNRTRVSSNTQGFDHIYSYYADNRLMTEARPNGVIAQYSYDAAGNRSFATEPNADPTKLADNWSYVMDANGRVVSAASGTEVQQWTYDTFGNVLTYKDTLGGVTKKIVENTYNAGNVAWKVVTKEPPADKPNDPLQTTTTTTDYDKSQRAQKMTIDGPSDQEYTYEQYGDGREKSVKGKGGKARGSSTSSYDVNKIRTGVDLGQGDGQETKELETFTADNEGHLISSKTNKATNATSDDVTVQYLYAEGNPVGSVKTENNNKTFELDTGDYKLVQLPNDTRPSGGTSYVVTGGETLQSIAGMVYGNPSLWFVLADANGIDGSTPLVQGQSIKVPSTVQSGTITADNHVLYSEGDIVGSTLPNLKTPPPKKKSKCGAIVAIIATVIVAVVVSVVTIGVAAPAAAAASAAVVGAVGATLAAGVGIATAVAIGAAIAVVGSFLRQGILLLAKVQDKFSWKDLAADAAVGAFSGAAAGVGGIAAAAAESVEGLSTAGSTTARIAGAALQAAGAATGQKIKDGRISNWTGIATAAIGGLAAANGAIDSGRAAASGIEQTASTLTKVIDGVSKFSRYVSPWANLAESYARNHKLTTQDWVGAVSGTLTEAINDYVDFGNKTFDDRMNTTGYRLAAKAVVAGGISLVDRDSARDYLANGIGDALGAVVDGELLQPRLQKLKDKADNYTQRRLNALHDQAGAAGGAEAALGPKAPSAARTAAQSIDLSQEPDENGQQIDDTSMEIPSQDEPTGRVVKVKKGQNLQKIVGVKDPEVLDKIAQLNGFKSRHEIPAGGEVYVPDDLSVLDSMVVSESVSSRGTALAKQYAQRQADARARAAAAAEPVYAFAGPATLLSSIGEDPVRDLTLERGYDTPAGEPVSPPEVPVERPREEVTVGSLATNFFQGAADIVVQPAKMFIDFGQLLGAASYGAITGDYFEPEWVSDTGKRASAGASIQELVLPELVSQNRFGAMAMAGTGLYQAVMAEDWNGVARMAGSFAAGAVLGGKTKRQGKGSGGVDDVSSSISSKEALGSLGDLQTSSTKISGLLPEGSMSISSPSSKSRTPTSLSKSVPVTPSSDGRGGYVAEGVKAGEFSIVDWSGYPAGVPKPEGPVRLLTGSEYKAARKDANRANATIRKDEGLVGQRVDVHEIKPVKFGGSPTDRSNKVVLPRDLHRKQVTPWWNQLQKNVGG